MKKLSKIFILLLFCTISTHQAYGYIDPGTGSYIFQILIAGLAASIYTIKIYWRNIKSFSSSIFSSKKK